MSMVRMLCGRASTLAHLISPLSVSQSILHRFRAAYSYISSSAYPKMSSAVDQIVEHIVLFKVKPDTDPSKVNAMVSGLNGLNSLDQIIHLTAGRLFRCRSASLSFTHLLHSRYKSKSDLSAYSAHPSHVGVVAEFVRPIVDDIMAVDWIASGSVNPKPGSAMRVTFLKLTEDLEEKQRSELLGVVEEMKTKFPSIEQFSFGENFSPDRAKGFSMASIAVYPGSNELDAMDSDSNSEIVKSLKQKVENFLDDFIFVDYVVPHPKSGVSI